MVLADGPTPSNSPDGPKTGPSGPDHALANLSARQAEEKGLLTSGIYGRTGSISLHSHALKQFLVSKLQAKADWGGLISYKLTWKTRITPAQQRIYALRGSVRRNSDNAYIGWPAPIANDATGSTHCYSAGNKLKAVLKLPGAVRAHLHGRLGNGRPVPMKNPGSLNPALSCWLMGYPTRS